MDTRAELALNEIIAKAEAYAKACPRHDDDLKIVANGLCIAADILRKHFPDSEASVSLVGDLKAVAKLWRNADMDAGCSIMLEDVLEKHGYK